MIPKEFLLEGDVDEGFQLSLLRLSVSAWGGTEQDVALAVDFARATRVWPGRLVLSPSGRFVVTWMQGIGRLGGERPPGIVVVTDMLERVAFYDLSVTRPKTAAVSDEGRFVVGDSTWENFSSTVVCRDFSGKVLWQLDFDANVGEVAVSASGELACVTTLVNPKVRGSSPLLLLLDGRTGAVVRVRDWCPGVARRLEFRASELFVVFPSGEAGAVLWTE